MELTEQIKNIASMLSRLGVNGFGVGITCDRPCIVYKDRAWFPNPVQSASLQATIIKDGTVHQVHIIPSLPLSMDLIFEEFKMIYRATETRVHFIDEIEYVVMHKTSQKQYSVTRMLDGGLDQVLLRGEALTAKNPVVKTLLNQFDELMATNESTSFTVRERNWKTPC